MANMHFIEVFAFFCHFFHENLPRRISRILTTVKCIQKAIKLSLDSLGSEVKWSDPISNLDYSQFSNHKIAGEKSVLECICDEPFAFLVFFAHQILNQRYQYYPFGKTKPAPHTGTKCRAITSKRTTTTLQHRRQAISTVKSAFLSVCHKL